MLEQTFLTDLFASTVIYDYGTYPVDTVRYEMWHIDLEEYFLRIADFEGPTNILIKFNATELFP